MNIREVFEKKELVLSFEVFPPKASSPIDVIYKTLDELKGLSPDFISVTYGAGGNSKDNRTAEIAGLIKNKYSIEPLAHLTCINSTKNEIMEVLEGLKEKNIENVLALRGDVPKGEFLRGDYKYSSDLISSVKEFGGFNIAGACYPEGYTKQEQIETHVKMLLRKKEEGASHLISQLFFNNDDFYKFIDCTNKNNLDIPIQAGIMPVLNRKQIERIVSMCGAKFPRKFMKIVERYDHDQIALRDAGIAYAVEQIIDLASSDVDGIHLYTMNNAYVAKRISESVSSIIASLNRKVV
ncbi:MAG: methylenetetrahydrofolate reductase [NAD(P)H] [Sarcina sp.]